MLRRRSALRGLALGLSVLVVAGACASSGSGGKATGVDAVLSSAVQLQNEGRLDQAKVLYEQVLKKDPQNVAALFDLGDIAQRQGNTAEALSQYAAALAANPRFVPALFNEATIYVTSDPSHAALLYREVIRFQPLAPTAYLNLGFILFDQGQLKAALHDFAEALNQDPTLASRLPKRVRRPAQLQARHLPPPPSPSPSRSPSTSASPLGTSAP